MIASIIFDIVLAGTVLLGLALGWKNGFIKTVAKPIKFIASVVLAFLTASPVGKGIISPIIYGPVENKLTAYLTEKCAGVTASNISELPTLVKFAASLCGVDIAEAAGEAGGQNVTTAIVNAVSTPVIDVISVIIAFILIYFASRIALSILISIVNSVVDNGIAGKLNSFLGCVFSFALSVVIAWVIVSVSDFVFHLPVLESVSWVQEFVGGPIYRLLKSLNPIDLLLSF